MTLRSVAVVMMILCPVRPAAAQGDRAGTDTVRQSLSGTVIGDGERVLRLAGAVATSPLRWTAAGWLQAGGTVLLTGASSLADGDVRAAMDRNRSALAGHLDDVFTQYGTGLNVALVSIAAYGGGLLTGNTWLRETALLTGSAVLFSGAAGVIVKVATGRARPYTGLGNHAFHHFTSDADYLSFPSGHVVVAFAVSTVLSERLSNPWATAGLYGVAGMTALSRIYSREHWFSDVVFGAILSSAIAHTVVSEYEEQEPPSCGSGLGLEAGPGSITLYWRL